MHFHLTNSCMRMIALVHSSVSQCERVFHNWKYTTKLIHNDGMVGRIQKYHEVALIYIMTKPKLTEMMIIFVRNLIKFANQPEFVENRGKKTKWIIEKRKEKKMFTFITFAYVLLYDEMDSPFILFMIYLFQSQIENYHAVKRRIL